jgi:hypothetical protein
VSAVGFKPPPVVPVSAYVIMKKVIQPVVEPQAPADGHTGVDHLMASWSDISALDEALARKMKEMTTR